MAHNLCPPSLSLFSFHSRFFFSFFFSEAVPTERKHHLVNLLDAAAALVRCRKTEMMFISFFSGSLFFVSLFFLLFLVVSPRKLYKVKCARFVPSTAKGALCLSSAFVPPFLFFLFFFFYSAFLLCLTLSPTRSYARFSTKSINNSYNYSSLKEMIRFDYLRRKVTPC